MSGEWSNLDEAVRGVFALRSWPESVVQILETMFFMNKFKVRLYYLAHNRILRRGERSLKKYVGGAFGLVLLGLNAGPAQATESGFLNAIGLGGPWVVTANGKVVVSPRWSGSDKYSAIAYPTLSFTRPGEQREWESPDDSVSYRIPLNDVVSVGPVIAYRSGRYTTDDRNLAGIHDVRWTLEPGLFFQVWAVPKVLRARIEIRRGFRDKDGFVADLGVDWVNQIGGFTIGVGPRMSIADGSYMRNQYGVTFQDAALNGQVTPFKATSGIQSAGVYASAGYQFTEQWSGTLHGGYSRLVGDAADSPIVRKFGDRDQWTVGATVGYSFDFAGF